MNNYNDDLRHIRKVMENSTTFLSLSGWSGILAGIIALVGSYITYFLMEKSGFDYMNDVFKGPSVQLMNQITISGIIIFVLAVVTGVIFTIRKTFKNQQPIWSKASKNLIIALAIPCMTGGFYTAFLIHYKIYFLISPSLLIFYGLGLINASKYTLNSVFWLGIIELSFGMIGIFIPGYGFILWILGFGIAHIMYGITMHLRSK